MITHETPTSADETTALRSPSPHPPAGRGRRPAEPERPVGSPRERVRKLRDASDAEDLEFIDTFLAGDERGFTSLFDKYRERVYAVAYRFVRNKEDALEVTQEVFLRVHQRIADFKTDSRFFTWLYRVTVNRAIDFTRSRKTQAIPGLEPETVDSHGLPSRSREPDPSHLAEERELLEKLEAAVQRLSEKHRSVFLLHTAEDLSYRQIAEVLDCNIGTVMSRLFYARRKLKEILSGSGVDILEPKGE